MPFDPSMFGSTVSKKKKPAVDAAPPAQDDDWGWKPEEPQNNTTAGPRYGNLDDDLWSTNTGNDNNYNQVRAKNFVCFII